MLRAGLRSFIKGQYTQSLTQQGSDAQAVESGQWYKTITETDGLYVVLYVDGVNVESQEFPIGAMGTPGDTITVS